MVDASLMSDVAPNIFQSGLSIVMFFFQMRNFVIMFLLATEVNLMAHPTLYRIPLFQFRQHARGGLLFIFTDVNRLKLI